MHTHTLDTNGQEMSIRSPGGTNGAHRPWPGRQERIAVGRRPFLQGAIAGIAGMMAGVRRHGEADAASPRGEAERNHGAPGLTQTGNTVLLAYFSRAGENYYYGDRIDLEVGNTEVLAGMIRDLMACDVYRIEPVDPYRWDYEETRTRNVQEQDADARPAIANPLTSIKGYDVVLLGSPIWNVRAPMIMSTFAEGFDFTGKTVFPVRDLRREWAGIDGARLRRLVPRGNDRGRSRGAGRGGAGWRRRRRGVATAHRPARGMRCC